MFHFKSYRQAFVGLFSFFFFFLSKLIQLVRNDKQAKFQVQIFSKQIHPEEINESEKIDKEQANWLFDL